MDAFTIFFSFAMDSYFFWAVLCIAIAVFSVVSWALFYHWRHYGSGSAKVALAETVYIIGGAAFLACAFVSLLAA